MKRFRFYCGLFCITMATLMLQIVQTRILSVVAWYYLAFFAISCAMFGLTAGAVWVYLAKDRFTARTLSYDLAAFGSAFAASVAVALAVQMTLSPISMPGAVTVVTWLEIMACLSVPFVFSGIVVSLALTRSPFPIGRVYGVDLAGAATGCLGALALLNLTDGPTAVLWIAVVGAVGAVLFAGSGIGGAAPAGPALAAFHKGRFAVAAVLVVAAAANHLHEGFLGLRPIFVKYRIELVDKRPVFEEWNSFSRVAVYAKDTREPVMWGAAPTYRPEEWLIDQRHVNIDGMAATFAYRLEGDLARAGFLRFDITNLAFHLPGQERALVVGVGAGRDMVAARLFGVRDVVGVEINPILVRLLTREPGFAEYTGLGRIEGLRLVNDEARSWLTRHDDAFDVIQMSLVDTLAATGAGAFSLTENGLYTVEAWRLFLRRLRPGGVFSVSRWFNPEYLTETGRMVSLAMAALFEQGVHRPENHVFLARSRRIATLIVARDPFRPEAAAALERAAARLGFEVVAAPGRPTASPVLRDILSAPDRAALDRRPRDLPLDLTPATDDRPFFFNLLPPLDIARVAQVSSGRIGETVGVVTGNVIATMTLFVLFVLSALLVTATIVLPLGAAVRDVGRRLAVAGTAYFALIGVGFMVTEVALLQRFSVFFGHPATALSVVLFSLILAAGGGSLLSDRFRIEGPRVFAAWAGLTGGYLLSLPFWLPAVTTGLADAALAVRAAACVAVIAPAATLMGFGFPTGMRLISAVDARPTPWLWGINGAAGVMASAFAVALSISYGISATLALGGLCYIALVPAAFGIGFFGDAGRGGRRRPRADAPRPAR